MQPTPTPPTQDNTTLYRQALHNVLTLANDLATRIHAAATADEPTLTLDQASVALDRTARIVRRTVLLAQRLESLASRVTDSTANRTAARKQVIRAVEDAIHRVARHTPDHQNNLRAELQERLDRPDFEADLAARPIPDLIEELARDLGVAAQGRSFIHPRRTPQDIDHLIEQALRPAVLAKAELSGAKPENNSQRTARHGPDPTIHGCNRSRASSANGASCTRPP